MTGAASEASIPCADPAPIWRCGVGDAISAVDVLYREWLGSKRRALRDAAAELDQVLQAIYDARMLCGPTSYAEAEEAGKVLLASVGRNAERQDAEERLGPKDEHAVPPEEAGDAQRPSE